MPKPNSYLQLMQGQTKTVDNDTTTCVSCNQHVRLATTTQRSHIKILKSKRMESNSRCRFNSHEDNKNSIKPCMSSAPPSQIRTSRNCSTIADRCDVKIFCPLFLHRKIKLLRMSDTEVLTFYVVINHGDKMGNLNQP